MFRENTKYKSSYMPDTDKNPADKDRKYHMEMLQGMYGSYLRGGTGISMSDRGNIAVNRSYGRGEHNTDHIKTFLTGGKKFPNDGTFSSFTQSNDKTIVELSSKAWENVDWTPISPMPKIKAIVSRLADIDYEVGADAIDPLSRDREMDKKAHALFFSRYQGFLKRFAANAGIDINEPEFIPESEEEMDMHMAEEGFKEVNAMYQEIAIDYSFKTSEYDEIRAQHIDDIFENGVIALRVDKDPNSGRFYVVYVDIENSFVQASKHADFRDSEYAGEFDSISISQMISYGASRKDVLSAVKYYSGWRGNIEVDGDIGYQDLTTRHNNMKVCVVRGAWIDNDVYRYKNYTTRYGAKRMVEQTDDWDKVYDLPNKKTSETRGRVVRQGCWVLGTDFCYGYGKISNQPREDDRDVLLPYRFYKLRQRAMVPQCIPFIDRLQVGWSKLQNAFIVAMNSGHAVNVSMLQNLSYGQDKIDWYDALKVMRGTGVLPYSQSLSGRYEGGNPSPITPIQGGVGEMMQESLTFMELNMNNIHNYTGLNPLQLAEQTDPNTPVRTSQMMMNATNDVLKPFLRAGFKVKQDGAKVINAMLATCSEDKGYMKRAYGGILSEAAIITLGQAKKRGAKYGLILRVRPNDEEKSMLLEMANLAMQAQLITPDVNMYIREKVMEGSNLRRMRKWMAYKIEKERERKHAEQMQLVREQSQGNQQHEAMKQQTIQMEAQLKTQGAVQELDHKAQKDKELEYERRLTALMSKAMESEQNREQLLNEAREYAKQERDVQDVGADTPTAG